MRRSVNPRQLDKLIAKGSTERIFCRLLDEVLWRDRDDALRAMGYSPISSQNWHEVSKSEALGLLSDALAFDLCYGVKQLPPSNASDLAEDFLSRFHWQARYFTNSERPWSRANLNGWTFAPLTKGTIDTGVVVKVGNQFGGILWISSSD